MRSGLNRRARPSRFSQIAGQDAASALLARAARERSSAVPFLFSGPRGSGKTSAARIMAKALNCESPEDGEPCGKCPSCLAADAGTHLDVIEIDAASNRSIDDVRSLRESVALAPMMGRVKVYILDEVHMLTTEAFNALLKTLEEPPPTAAFIFATTDPHKVPVTIRSRCVHVRFRRITPDVIASRLRELADSEGQEADDEALAEIAKGADGALRDAVTLLEQASSIADGKRITLDVARSLMGGCDGRAMASILALTATDPARARAELRGVVNGGAPPERVLDEMYSAARDAWAAAMWGGDDGAAIPSAPADGLRRAARAAASLMPRARAGLRADVFAELLFEGIYDAFHAAPTVQTEMPRADASRREARPAPPRQEAPSPAPGTVPKNRFTDRPMPVRVVKQDEPAKPKPAPTAAPQAASPAEDALLARAGIASPALRSAISSLPIHALCALIDARAEITGGELVIDTSRVRPLARSILELPRVRRQIELALKAAGGERSAPAAPAVDPSAAKEPAPKEPGAPAVSEVPRAPDVHKDAPVLTIDHLSAKLGADLLVMRSLGRDDDDASIEGAVQTEEDA